MFEKLADTKQMKHHNQQPALNSCPTRKLDDAEERRKKGVPHAHFIEVNLRNSMGSVSSILRIHKDNPHSAPAMNLQGFKVDPFSRLPMQNYPNTTLGPWQPGQQSAVRSASSFKGV